MKYITLDQGSLKPLVILFSHELEHAEVAKLFGRPVIGAGFVTIRNPESHTAGFSTSLGVGPDRRDEAAIEHDLVRTARQYPLPPAPLDLGAVFREPSLLDLTPEEQAAVLGTCAPRRCHHCGRLLTPECTSLTDARACAACDRVLAERSART